MAARGRTLRRFELDHIGAQLLWNHWDRRWPPKLHLSDAQRLMLERVARYSAARPERPRRTLWQRFTGLGALVWRMLAADLTMGLTPTFFINNLPNAVQVANLTLASAKSVVFGFLIALIGCHYGLRVKPNTESLGQGTTASVVTSITIVIIVDALFAIVFRNVGV